MTAAHRGNASRIFHSRSDPSLGQKLRGRRHRRQPRVCPAVRQSAKLLKRVVGEIWHLSVLSTGLTRPSEPQSSIFLVRCHGQRFAASLGCGWFKDSRIVPARQNLPGQYFVLHPQFLFLGFQCLELNDHGIGFSLKPLQLCLCARRRGGCSLL